MSLSPPHELVDKADWLPLTAVRDVRVPCVRSASQVGKWVAHRNTRQERRNMPAPMYACTPEMRSSARP